MRGQSVPAGIITAPGVNGHTAARDERLPYDPELSKKLLAEAGYPDGFEVTLDCPNDRYINDEAICVAAIGMFAKIGVDVTLDAKTKSQHFSEVKEGDANGMTSDMYMLGGLFQLLIVITYTRTYLIVLAAGIKLISAMLELMSYIKWVLKQIKIKEML